jgi:hypothetical protein
VLITSLSIWDLFLVKGVKFSSQEFTLGGASRSDLSPRSGLEFLGTPFLPNLFSILSLRSSTGGSLPRISLDPFSRAISSASMCFSALIRISFMEFALRRVRASLKVPELRPFSKAMTKMSSFGSVTLSVALLKRAK